MFEFMPISAVLRAMISEGRTADEIRAQASAEGMRTMYESARRLVLEGATSLREMRRITAFDAVGAEF